MTSEAAQIWREMRALMLEVHDTRRAVAEATVHQREAGKDPRPEIMVPLVGSVRELQIIRDEARRILAEVGSDAGVELDSLYTADVTRTLPVSGRFSEPQRRVYEAVLSAQEAGIAAARPGAAWSSTALRCRPSGGSSPGMLAGILNER